MTEKIAFATIGAFTAGVPTVPVAYSRKFAGFFGTLGYPILVNLETAGTDDAVAQTLALVADRDRLAEVAGPPRQAAQQAIDVFLETLRDTLTTSLEDTRTDDVRG